MNPLTYCSWKYRENDRRLLRRSNCVSYSQLATKATPAEHARTWFTEWYDAFQGSKTVRFGRLRTTLGTVSHQLRSSSAMLTEFVLLFGVRDGTRTLCSADMEHRSVSGGSTYCSWKYRENDRRLLRRSNCVSYSQQATKTTPTEHA